MTKTVSEASAARGGAACGFRAVMNAWASTATACAVAVAVAAVLSTRYSAARASFCQVSMLRRRQCVHQKYSRTITVLPETEDRCAVYLSTDLCRALAREVGTAMAAVVDACPTCGEAACGTRRGFCKPRRNQPWQLNGGRLSTSRGPEYAAAGVVASCRRKGQSGRCTSPNVLVCETAQTVDLALPSLAIPSVSARATSMHPLILGGSPGSTGTMSLYFALKQLGVSTVHYSRMFNATTGEETTSYGLQPPGGAPSLLPCAPVESLF
eukprot:1721064-Pleurochrysis_carterae.AAC.1